VATQAIAVLDFCSQDTQVIAWRMRELTSFSAALPGTVRYAPKQAFKFRAAMPLEVGLRNRIDWCLVSAQLGETH
jgi:GMP synthase-like glutamine amidotransferase